jgi:hypothetical protein
MRSKIVIFTVLSSLLLSSLLQAGPSKSHLKTHKLGKDPIGWSLSPASGFPAQTSVGSSYEVTYTLVNNLPFTVPLSVSRTSTNGGKFSMITNCNTTLQPNATCLVHLSLQPIGSPINNVVVTMAYHHNRVPLPQLSSTSASLETAERINGYVSVPLPAQAYIGGSYPVTFTIVNNSNVAVTTSSVNITGFTSTSNTCASSIAEHSSCVVTGTFVPSVVGHTALGVTYVYNKGSIPLTTQTNVVSGVCHQITSYTALPLPTNTLIYSNNVAKFVFTNNCLSGTENISAVSFTSDSTASPAPTITPGLNTCSTSLAPGASCTASASIVPNATYSTSNDLSLSAALTYTSGGYTDATSSEAVSPLTNQSGAHTLMFVNQCAQSVWYGFSPGGNPPDPTTNASWQDYQLDQQVLGAAPPTKTLTFNQYTGGGIFGRTGCETDPVNARYGTCQAASCTPIGNATGRCAYAPIPPYTNFEENMLSAPATDGVYDVSVINGFNIPGEFRSLAPYSAVVTPTDFSNTCGNSAGAITQPAGSGLSACSWSFTPPSQGGTDCTAGTQTDNTANYYMVSYGSSDDGCTPGSCSGGQVCGTSFSPNSSSEPLGTPLYRHCGTFQGYWTVADYVGYSNSGQWGTCDLYSHYAMTTTLDSIKPVGQSTYGFSTLTPNANPLPAAMVADIFACQPTSELSCYTSPGTPNVCFNKANPYFALNSGYTYTYQVCGCHNWNTATDGSKTLQSSQCTADNPLWDSQVYPRILWLKQACPTAYSYQFDDKSSSFQCNVPAQKTSYQITFCPGGVTGAPA